MKRLMLTGLLLLGSCSSIRMVSNWKNPEPTILDVNKVLIVGMTYDMDLRTDFETKLQNAFEERGVESFRSIDLFDVDFTASEKTEQQLSEVEQQLLNKGFDAILFTKVIGSANKKTLMQKIDALASVYGSFSEDYLDNQSIYYEDEKYYNEYTVYHAETSLYCICVDKERELNWRATIDIYDSKNIRKSVDDYVKLVISTLKEEDIVFRE